MFEFESHPIRTTLLDGELWFNANDVCDALLQEGRILSVEHVQQLTGGDLYTTVRGYAKTHNLPGDTKTLAAVGRRATKACKLRGIRLGVVADEQYGSVNSYPVSVLEAAFNDPSDSQMSFIW